MSILIKGMEMPKKVLTVEIHPDGYVCLQNGNKVGEAIPVPHHGRLIDGDRLDAYLKNAATMADEEAKEAYIDARAEARTMPVIIPAEEGE